MPYITCYPLTQPGDALLRYPDWFASNGTINLIFYSYLTATRRECIENVVKRDIFHTIKPLSRFVYPPYIVLKSKNATIYTG
jgi:hypothetical protein